MTIRRRFAPITERREVKVKCQGCGKSLKRVLKKTCYDNGFHHVPTTLAKYRKELDKQERALIKSGCLCRRCEVGPTCQKCKEQP